MKAVITVIGKDQVGIIAAVSAKCADFGANILEITQSVLDKYHPSDMARAKNIAQLLKDADGLDRVRICDLDENFLRRESSVHREPFAHQLYIRYQTVVGLPLVPDFVPEMLKHRNREKIWL